ncbi:MAG: ferritin-like domain-containing protein [Chloroflexi bacterium]|nr:ferritin-like domain-containing protein [Chloroflexota bacterium]
MRLRRLNTAYGVSDNRFLMRRYAYVEERLFTTIAGWTWDTPSLEHKVEFARLSYEGALAADALRRRADELFPPTAAPERPPALAALDRFCNEVANADDPAERLAGAIRVVKPHLLAAYRRHLAETDDIIDGPTAAVLRRIIPEVEDHIAWGETALAEVTATPAAAARARAWEAHLRAALDAIGGVCGEGGGALPAYRRPDPPARDLTDLPARDDRFNIVPVEDYAVASMGDDKNEILRHLLYSNAYGEMEAADILGRVLADAPELPWSMRLDLVRQFWDEARHTEMSWRRMEELGGPPHPTPPIPRLILEPLKGLSDPLERLLVLQRVIEGRVTERHRYRVHYLTAELDDPVTARLYEYIVADERAHVGYSEWIPKLIGDDPERLARLDRIHAMAEPLFERILTRRQDRTAGMRAGGTGS